MKLQALLNYFLSFHVITFKTHVVSRCSIIYLSFHKLLVESNFSCVGSTNSGRQNVLTIIAVRWQSYAYIVSPFLYTAAIAAGRKLKLDKIWEYKISRTYKKLTTRENKLSIRAQYLHPEQNLAFCCIIRYIFPTKVLRDII